MSKPSNTTSRDTLTSLTTPKVQKWDGRIMDNAMEVLLVVAGDDLGALTKELAAKAKELVECFGFEVNTLRIKDNESGQVMFRAYA